jgi:hypothetical protein
MKRKGLDEVRSFSASIWRGHKRFDRCQPLLGLGGEMYFHAAQDTGNANLGQRAN